MSQDWNQTFRGDTKYQVWITSYPTDSSETDDRGYTLVGQYDTIEEAAQCHIQNSSYEPYITKLVTYTTEIKEV